MQEKFETSAIDGLLGHTRKATGKVISVVAETTQPEASNVIDSDATVSEEASTTELVVTAALPKESETVRECARCGRLRRMTFSNPHLCLECEKLFHSRYMHLRNHHDWISVAKENSIDLWLQQPGETQWEYTVWIAYRDSYPGKKPSYRSVAEQLNCSVEAVKHIASRWTFSTRMQAWMAECDRLTLVQRQSEILGMNAAHITMAEKLRSKLDKAIDAIDPATLRPSELATLMKMTNEMERTARVDTTSVEDTVRALNSDNENPSLKKVESSKEDLNEILGILMKAGALGDVTHIGVRKTETTELAIGDGAGRSSVVTLTGGLDGDG